jgi:hypothetical protein
MTDATKEQIIPEMNIPGYENLARILTNAYDQSAAGKGKERHSKGSANPFDKQRIMAIGRDVGTGGHAFQICKKTQEANDMVARGGYAAARHELLGAIVYAAAMVMLIEEIEDNL